MLANLTSLIWGSGNTPVTTTTITTDTTSSLDLISTKDNYEDSPEGFNKFSIRATTPTDEEEADWVLVDRTEVGEASCGGVESITSATVAAPSIFTTTTTSRRATFTPAPSVTQGGEWSDGGTQGWLMTPPPCFTRSQAAPLASSPLENLLIEHPSMSVYMPRPTFTSAATTRIFPWRVVAHSTSSSCSTPSASPSSQPVLVEGEESSMKENTVEETENQVAEVPPPARGGVAQQAPSLLRAIDVLRPAQKAQRRREERRLKRAPLDRSNKVREVAAAGNKRAKRCDLMAPGKFSRVVNNRKC